MTEIKLTIVNENEFISDNGITFKVCESFSGVETIHGHASIKTASIVDGKRVLSFWKESDLENLTNSETFSGSETMTESELLNLANECDYDTCKATHYIHVSAVGGSVSIGYYDIKEGVYYSNSGETEENLFIESMGKWFECHKFDSIESANEFILSNVDFAGIDQIEKENEYYVSPITPTKKPENVELVKKLSNGSLYVSKKPEVEILKVVFRYNKKFDYVEMYYYDERKDMVCFCLEEGHNNCDYEYYLSTAPIKNQTPEVQERVQKLVDHYNSDELQVQIMKKLSRN